MAKKRVKKYRRALTENEKNEHRYKKKRNRHKQSGPHSNTRKNANGSSHSIRKHSTLDGALEELALSRALSLEMKLREEFSKYDQDGSGEIDAEEVKGIFVALGIGQDAEEDDDRSVFDAFWEEEMKRMDDDGDSKISFDEFVKYHNRFVDYANRTADINWALNNLTAHVEWSNARIYKEVNFLADAHRYAAALEEPSKREEVRKCVADIVGSDGMPSGDDQLMVLVGCITIVLTGHGKGHSPSEDWERFVDMVRSGEDALDIVLGILNGGDDRVPLDAARVAEAESLLKSYSRVEQLHAARKDAPLAPRPMRARRSDRDRAQGR